jgi:tRNA(fMet)-specific endonuclease VapC
VDSDWLIDGLQGIPSAITALESLKESGLGISIVSFGEIYEGAFGFPDPTIHLQELRTFVSGLAVLPLDDAIMETFGRTRASLRRRGLLIPYLDLLIAATALAYDLTLLTRNRRHFQRIPDLKLYEAT